MSFDVDGNVRSHVWTERWRILGYADRGTLMEAVERIRRQYPGRKIIVIESIEDDEIVEAVA